VHVIGVDWAASDETKCGLALAELHDDGALVVLELLTGREAPEKRSAPQIIAWLRRHPDALLAIDAPLGWPARLADGVAAHVAGEPLGLMADASAFFTRATDRFIQQQLRKSPLEVGADRIARTAFSALCLIRELRDATGLPLPMAWEAGERGVLEVYPAATLKVLAPGTKVPPYKKPEQHDARRSITTLLADHVRFDDAQRQRAIGSDHLLDAILCTLAGADFTSRRAMSPPADHRDLARREGWIWVRGRAI
jgi:hypothetical protein